MYVWMYMHVLQGIVRHCIQSFYTATKNTICFTLDSKVLSVRAAGRCIFNFWTEPRSLFHLPPASYLTESLFSSDSQPKKKKFSLKFGFD